MNILEIFQSKKGDKLSSQRVWFNMWNAGVLAMVIYLVITKGEFPKIDATFVALYTTVVGSKVLQSFAEHSKKATIEE